MAHVLIHLNVEVSDDLQEEVMVSAAIVQVVVAARESISDFEKLVALAEVADYDVDEEEQ